MARKNILGLPSLVGVTGQEWAPVSVAQAPPLANVTKRVQLAQIAALSSGFLAVSNISALATASVPPVAAASAVVQNYAASGDGGGGVFVFSTANHAADVANDLAGAIFVPPSSAPTGASGAWVRQYSGPVNIRWFGATGNGVTADDGAFMHFEVWARAQGTASLYIPPGTYHFSGANTPQFYGAGADLVSTSQWLYGIKQVSVSAYGATIDGIFLGGAGPYQDNLHYGLTKAISSGATSITLSNASDASKFTVSTWALLGQIDMQGFGYPQNLYIFEYVYITNINSGTGVITVRDVIRHNYLTTFPNYSAGDGFHANLGGPATLFAMTPQWDSDIAISGMTCTSTQLFGGVRKVHLIDCDLSAVGNLAPSNSMYYTLERCKLSFTLNEIDKVVSQLSFIECECEAASSIQIVSSSIENVLFQRCRIGCDVLGVGKYCRIEQSNIAALLYGESFGSTETISIEDSNIPTLTPSLTGNPHQLSSFSFANGVFSIGTGSGPVTDAVPGAVYFFYDNVQQANLGVPFRVLDVQASGGNTKILTTLNAIPTLYDFSSSAVSYFNRHPCTRLFVRNSTGHQDVLSLSKVESDGLPPYSYGECTVITGANQTGPTLTLWGNLVSVTVNVVRAYTGAQNTLTLDAGSVFGFFVIDSTGHVNTSALVVRVNLKNAGVRTVTPGGVTGSQSGDTLTNPGASTNVWFPKGANTYVSAATGSDTLDQQAIVEVQYVTDQGSIVDVPLLFNGTTGALPTLPA